MDLRNLTVEELYALENSILTEKERREAVRNIPLQIATLSATYQAGGGDITDLRDVLG